MAFTPADLPGVAIWLRPSTVQLVDGRVEKWVNAPAPAAGLPLPAFGTQTHCAQFMTPDVYGQLNAAVPAVKVVRDEMFWAGVYDAATNTFSLPAKYSAYLDAIAASGHHLLLELLWGHPDVTGHVFGFPDTPEERAKFCDYASFVVGEVKAKGVPLFGAELWNEISGTWSGVIVDGELQNYGQLSAAQRDTLADAYVLLAQSVRARLLADHPGVKLAVGADVSVQLDWLNRVISRGVLTHGDALAIHPYGTSDNTLPALRAAMASAGHPDMPLWVTEFRDSANNVGYMARVAARCLAAKAELLSWYLAKPHQTFANGLLLADGSISPEGVGFQFLGDLMAGATYVGPATVPLGVSAEVFDTVAQGRVTVMWADNGSTVTISGETDRRDASGAPVAQAASYSLTGSPLYVFGAAVAIGAAGSGPLADYAAQFKGTQGAPWEYGFYDAAGVWTLMPFVDAENRYRAAGTTFHTIAQTTLHPQSEAIWTTVRVKFPAQHRVRLDGRFRKGTGGDLVNARIRAGTTVLAQGEVAPTEDQLFDIVADLPAGTWLEFSINAGPTNSFDATQFAVTITETSDALTAIPVDFGAVPPPPTGASVTLIFSDDGIVRWQAAP